MSPWLLKCCGEARRMTKKESGKGLPLSAVPTLGAVKGWRSGTGAQETKPVPPPLWPAEQQTMVASSSPSRPRSGPPLLPLPSPYQLAACHLLPTCGRLISKPAGGALPSDLLGAQLGDIENLLCLLEAEA